MQIVPTRHAVINCRKNVVPQNCLLERLRHCGSDFRLMDKWQSAYLLLEEYTIKMAMNAFCGGKKKMLVKSVV